MCLCGWSRKSTLDLTCSPVKKICSLVRGYTSCNLTWSWIEQDGGERLHSLCLNWDSSCPKLPQISPLLAPRHLNLDLNLCLPRHRFLDSDQTTPAALLIVHFTNNRSLDLSASMTNFRDNVSCFIWYTWYYLFFFLRIHRNTVGDMKMTAHSFFLHKLSLKFDPSSITKHEE